MHKPIFRTLHSFTFLFFLNHNPHEKAVIYIPATQVRKRKKKNHIRSETIILLRNVQIFANNCCRPAGLEECSILFFCLFDRGLPLNLSSALTGPGFLPAHWCSGLGPAAGLYPGSSTGAPGKDVKDVWAPTFAFPGVVLAVFAYHIQINGVDAQYTCKPLAFPGRMCLWQETTMNCLA